MMSDQRPDVEAPEVPKTEEIKTRPSCAACGGDMTGEHHKAKKCKTCRPARKSKSTSDTVETSSEAVAVETAESPAVVKVVPDLVDLEETPQDRSEYWMGTTQKSPFQNVYAAGKVFPMAMGSLDDKNGDGQPTFSGAKGVEVMLSGAEVEAVQKSVARKVVRWAGTGKNRRGIKMDMDSMGYRQAKGDEPLGRYLYMLRTDSLGHNAKQGEPETMVD